MFKSYALGTLKKVFKFNGAKKTSKNGCGGTDVKR